MTITSKETSAGLVLVRTRTSREYLLLLYPHSKIYWGLCKGHVEPGENKEQAALREAQEETHLSKINMIPGFESCIKYIMRHNNDRTSKEVTFFIAEVFDKEDGHISSEHKDLIWLPFLQAREKLRYQKDKNILTSAENFLEERKKE